MLTFLDWQASGYILSFIKVDIKMHLSTKVLILVVVVLALATEVANAGPVPVPAPQYGNQPNPNYQGML
jgi:hypothetical protein